MKVLKIALLAVPVVLSLAAGMAKLVLMPAEVEFFASAGLGRTSLFLLGAIQVMGAGLAVFGRTRSTGLLAIAAGFLVSSVVIFMTGNAVFGIVSLVPVALAILFWKFAAA